MATIDNYSNIYDYILENNTIDMNCYLGNQVTEEQSANIANCTFNGLPIGAYWTIDGINYRIMAQDQFYGYSNVSTHHVVVMPDKCYSKQTFSYLFQRNTLTSYSSETSNYLVKTYDPYISRGFGSEHVLLHRHNILGLIKQYYDSTDTNSSVLMYRYIYADVKSWIINNSNIYGIKSNAEFITNMEKEDIIQFPIFKYNNSIRFSTYGSDSCNYWVSSYNTSYLRSSASNSGHNNTYFDETLYDANSGGSSTGYLSSTNNETLFAGIATNNTNSNTYGVRPAFLVY